MLKGNRSQENQGRISCNECHSRKVKCNSQEVGFPCTNCRERSCPDTCCLYLKRKRRSARPPPFAAPVQTGVPILPRTPGTAASANSTPSQEGAESHEGGTGLMGHDPDAAGDDVEYIYKRCLVEFMDQDLLTDRPIDRTARLNYVGTDVSNFNFLVQQHFSNITSDTFHFPTNRIARRHTCYEPDRLPIEALQLPPKSTVDKLLEAYFKHVNPGFPVVDEKLFMSQYQARDAENPPSLLLLHAILVVGAHVYYVSQPERESMKAVFFRRAKGLFDARFEDHRDVIVQAALLLTWHADGPEDVAANGWFWLGIAVRTATGMGMHRDAEKSTLVTHNKRMWRRVWWLLFQCDTLMSVQYGRPQSIHLEDTDVQKLKPEDFQDCGSEVRTDYIMQSTELCMIISRALRDRFRPSASSRSRQTVLREIDEELAAWSFQLPPFLKLWPTPSTDPWAASLQLTYNMFLILLHRGQLDSPGAREDSDICITSANIIQAVFQSLQERDQLRHLWISSINCLFTALIHFNTESRSSSAVLALAALQRYESALYSLRQLARYWPNALSILCFFENSTRSRIRARQGGENPHRSISASTQNDQCLTTVVEGQQTAARSEPLIQESGDAVPTPTDGPPVPPIDGQALRNVHASPSLGLSHAAESLQRTPASTDDRTLVHDESESWQEWRQSYIQMPELTQDLLFTF
ncbi:fungal-specific transcription factor domain-containing protein [Xylariomycetidae sp. FL2044]|nr:fungal-specific transcription factor domain-containing protein [Xylariomycetidae sp. FL2044]